MVLPTHGMVPFLITTAIVDGWYDVEEGYVQFDHGRLVRLVVKGHEWMEPERGEGLSVSFYALSPDGDKVHVPMSTDGPKEDVIQEANSIFVEMRMVKFDFKDGRMLFPANEPFVGKVRFNGLIKDMKPPEDAGPHQGG